MNTECWVERLGERGVEGMNESFFVTRKRIKGQSASWPVQKQSQSPASGQECLDVDVWDRYKSLPQPVSEGVTV